DLVLLVVDVSEPIEEIREKLVTSHDTLYERNEAPILTVLNKIDRVEDETVRRKREALSALAPNPVAVSAKTGENVEGLRERIDAELPPLEHERLVLPMSEGAMTVVSWIHDNAHVENVEYGEQIVVEFEGRPAVIERSRDKAGNLEEVSA
ncbi:MAG: GTPase HflX, partial [archaeon]